MSKKAFKVKNALSLAETSRQDDSTVGDLYYDTIKGNFAHKVDYWSFLESKVDIAYQADITSTYFIEETTENAIIKITGTPGSAFNLHGMVRNNNAKIIHIYNDTTQKMVIKPLSITEPTVINRIVTPKGTDMSIAKKSLVIVFYDDNAGNWVAIQASGGSGGTSFDQIQPSHGFSLLTPIYHDGTQWQKAQANTANTLATYVVTEVSTNAFTATNFGVVEIPSHGLTVGQFYYTSNTTAGDVTPTEPIFGFSNPVLYVQDNLLIHILVYRPSLIGDGSVSDSEISAIVAFPSFAEPAGFLYCDGRAVSRSTYNELFTLVGSRYGSGNGTTTFNLPDLRGQFLRGGVEVLDKMFLPGAIDISNDIISIPNHGFKHTGFKIRFTGSSLPAPLSTDTNYYVIVVDDNNIKIATSLVNAKGNAPLNLTSQGTGTHVITQWQDPDAATRYALQNGGNSGNAFGAYQDDEIKSHTHSQTWMKGGGANFLPQGSVFTPDTINTGATGGNETRSTNVTVGYFIRYAPKGAIQGQSVDVGIMVPFAGPASNIPNGYLLCDGSSLNRADYPKLFAAIGTSWGTASIATFNLPDTRGLFLRGVDGIAGRDPDVLTRTAIVTGGNTGNDVGSLQIDDFKSHTHSQFRLASASGVAAGGTFNESPIDSTGATGGNETRPKNVYVNYIIRY